MSNKLLMFHAGKMTTGEGLPNLYDAHYTNKQSDTLKFNAIKYVAHNEEKFKKVKIWLTHMALNREIGDRFDCFEGGGFFLNCQNAYTYKAIISEADVLQFHDETNDKFCFYGLDDLGHKPGCISITQDLENFYCALMRKNQPKDFTALLTNDLNMFHFEKLLDWQNYIQKLWLKKKIEYLYEFIGKENKNIKSEVKMAQKVLKRGILRLKTLYILL